MTAQIRGKLDHLLEVEEAAREIVKAIRHKRLVHIFPGPMRWRMRCLSWLPLVWQDRLIRRMLQRLDN
jgi:hypothetical protein